MTGTYSAISLDVYVKSFIKRTWVLKEVIEVIVVGSGGVEDTYWEQERPQRPPRPGEDLQRALLLVAAPRVGAMTNLHSNEP
jgi:hypothetical protein